MKAIPRSICLCFVWAITNSAHGQLTASRYQLGIMAGGFVYQGDLAPGMQGSVRTMRPGIMVFGARKMNETISFRVGFTVASLYGDESRYEHPAYRKERNFNFSSPVVELSPQMLFTPFGWVQRNNRVSAYLLAGLSLAWVHVRADASGFNAEYFSESENIPARIAEDLSRNPSRFIPALPLGMGLRYDLGPRFVLNAEMLYRRTMTDYLDGFQVAANPNLRDHYYSVMAGIAFKLGVKNTLDCPPVK